MRFQYYRHLHESGMKGWVQYQRLATVILQKYKWNNEGWRHEPLRHLILARDQRQQRKMRLCISSFMGIVLLYMIYSSLPLRQRQYQVKKRQRPTHR